MASKMAKVDSTPGKTRPRKKAASKRRSKGARRRRLATSKKDASGGSQPASVGRLERTRRLLLAALRVWELKRRLRD
jgi:hypothetical protein